MAAETDHPQLVPVEVSRAKLERELADWDGSRSLYRARGWLLVERDELTLDVAFTAPLALATGPLHAVVAAVRFDFSNYDLWPPSVTFVDLATGKPAPPPVRAVVPTEEGPRDLLVDAHIDNGQPFLCVPGTREYHWHPQHSGDDWLLHRGQGEGRLIPLCDLLWRAMALNVVGLRTTLQAMPAGLPAQIDVRLAQGDMSVLKAQAGLEAA